METETKYSFKSIVESKANVNGTWDNKKIHLRWSLKNCNWDYVQL